MYLPNEPLAFLQYADKGELLAEGVLRIISYNALSVILEIKNAYLHISGSHLTLRFLHGDGVSILGNIDSLVLERKKP